MKILISALLAIITTFAVVWLMNAFVYLDISLLNFTRGSPSDRAFLGVFMVPVCGFIFAGYIQLLNGKVK